MNGIGAADNRVPQVTVLLPVLNGERWIRECMESLRIQTFQDFEVLLIDDGCTDDSVAIAQMSGVQMRVINGPRNGLGAALAYGVEHAESPMLARQDQDDLSHPRRLELQVAYMNDHPNCILIGSWAELIDETGSCIGKIRMPKSTRAIRFSMNTYCPFIHTSVLMKRDSVVEAGNYQSGSGGVFAEDYDLWSRMAELGNLHNIQEALVSYRVHSQGITGRHGTALTASGGLIALRTMQNTIGTQLAMRDRELCTLFFLRDRRVSLVEAFRLYRILASLSLKSGFPLPEICKRWQNWVAPLIWTVRAPRHTGPVAK